MPGLHHLALGAHDVEAVAAFYRDVLNLAEITRHWSGEGQLRSIWLDLEGPVLMVERTSQPHREVDGVGSGPFLIAVVIEAARREWWCARLAAAGHPVEDQTSFTVYTRDPEGNRVALSHYPNIK
jgi:glyoxylase I family protein